MLAESARSAATAAPCALQYCRSMAIDAEPQPSSVCLTYGTSSQMPALPSGADWPNIATTLISKPAHRRSIRVSLRAAVPESAQHSDQRYQQNGGEKDDQQIAIGQAPRAASGKIVLYLTRALGQPGQVLVAQLPDGLVHFAVIDLGGFQRLLRLFGGKELPQGSFVGLARLGRPRRILAEFIDGNYVPLILRPHVRRIRKAQQKDYCQHPSTPLHKHVHPSSCNPFVG